MRRFARWLPARAQQQLVPTQQAWIIAGTIQWILPIDIAKPGTAPHVPLAHSLTARLL